MIRVSGQTASRGVASTRSRTTSGQPQATPRERKRSKLTPRSENGRTTLSEETDRETQIPLVLCASASHCFVSHPIRKCHAEAQRPRRETRHPGQLPVPRCCAANTSYDSPPECAHAAHIPESDPPERSPTVAAGPRWGGRVLISECWDTDDAEDTDLEMLVDRPLCSCPCRPRRPCPLRLRSVTALGSSDRAPSELHSVEHQVRLALRQSAIRKLLLSHRQKLPYTPRAGRGALRLNLIREGQTRRSRDQPSRAVKVSEDDRPPARMGRTKRNRCRVRDS